MSDYHPPAPIEDFNLWGEACRLRQKYWGRKVFLRGIVEISNYCRQNCLYCGLRRDNRSLPRYRMTFEEIFQCATIIKDLGYGTVVLQSGEDEQLDCAALCALIRRIKTDLKLAVTLSLGEWEENIYARWRSAGADRYLLKLETVNKDLYRRLRPGNILEKRLEAFKTLAGLGYETGSGLIAGLPDEDEHSIINGLDFLAALAPDMLSISPFIPHPQTPLGHGRAFDIAGTLRYMALGRLRMPYAHMPVTSALGLHGEKVTITALEAADVLMLSLTPEKVRRHYAIYPGKNEQKSKPATRAAEYGELLLKKAFELSPGPGSAWRVQKQGTN